MADDVNKPEPDPIPNSHPPIWPLVIADMQERDASGRAKYGVPLQPFNGRKPLIDAYQEVLDLAVYLRQSIYEQESRLRIVELIQDERDTLRGQVARLRFAIERQERMDDQTIEERDHAHDQLDAVLTLLGWQGEWTNAMPEPRSVAAELLAAEWVSREQHERAVDLRRQAEAMASERTRERDAMERRALAAEAELARLRFDQAERPELYMPRPAPGSYRDMLVLTYGLDGERLASQGRLPPPLSPAGCSPEAPDRGSVRGRVDPSCCSPGPCEHDEEAES